MRAGQYVMLLATLAQRVICNGVPSISLFSFYAPTDRFGGYSHQHGVHPKMHPCALRNFDSLRHSLIIFGRNVEEDQYSTVGVSRARETTLTVFFM